MSGINKVIIIGNLGNDIELKYTTDGRAIANLSIATSEKWKDKNSGALQEKTEWHRISIFGNLAEIANQYLRKGSKVYIEGKLQTRKWQDKNGEDRYTTEIVARDMQMLDRKNTDNSQNPSANQATEKANNAPADKNQTVSDDSFDDDIPF